MSRKHISIDELLGWTKGQLEEVEESLRRAALFGVTVDEVREAVVGRGESLAYPYSWVSAAEQEMLYCMVEDLRNAVENAAGMFEGEIIDTALEKIDEIEDKIRDENFRFSFLNNIGSWSSREEVLEEIIKKILVTKSEESQLVFPPSR